jgi:hypothetical protein
MKTVAWIIAGCLAGFPLVMLLSGSALAALLGMLGPLFAVVVSWVLMDRASRAGPGRLNAVMVTAFVVKMVFFGTYVVAVMRVPGVELVPFGVSFTAYFVALYAVEAWLIQGLSRRQAS